MWGSKGWWGGGPVSTSGGIRGWGWRIKGGGLGGGRES